MDIHVWGYNQYGIIDTYESIIWNTQYFGQNEFELTVAGTAENIALLQVGNTLMRSVDVGSNGEQFNKMIIENRKITFDAERGWILTVGGRGIKKIVGQRVIWEQTNLSGNVEDGIRQVLTDNIINPDIPERAVSSFVLDTAAGLTDTFEVQLFGENIAEWLESVCQTYDYGWDIYSSRAGEYVFKLYKGSEVPIIFSPEYDNLISATYEEDFRNLKNTALVGGEGEGTSQRVTSVGTTGGLNRYETYVDGSSVSSNGEIITEETYLSMLQNFGSEQLAQTTFTHKFEGEILQNLYKLGVDFKLGDVVRISNGLVSATSRIIEVIYSEDENGTSIVPTFSDWKEDD